MTAGAASAGRRSRRAHITDAGGVAWTASCEQRRSSVIPIHKGTAAGSDREEWLYFRSHVGVKRLGSFPATWAALGAEELLKLLARARPVKD